MASSEFRITLTANHMLQNNGFTFVLSVIHSWLSANFAREIFSVLS